jgi:hypothetical protein
MSAMESNPSYTSGIKTKGGHYDAHGKELGMFDSIQRLHGQLIHPTLVQSTSVGMRLGI